MGRKKSGLKFTLVMVSLCIISKVQMTKEKIDKLNYVKVKSFCPTNQTISQPMEWGKIWCYLQIIYV